MSLDHQSSSPLYSAVNDMEPFPIPSQPPSSLSPTTFPGPNPETIKALQDVLNDNHKSHHIFFNDRGFHNHITHQALAIWALGGDQHVINAAYKRNQKIQRPAYDSPEPITTENFNEHLGDENFFNAYLKFFYDLVIVQQRDVPGLLEEYIFSPKANFATKNSTGKHPEMLSRFLDAILHPMIHLGYGAEFGLPGMIVEGLAQTVVHGATSSPIIPASIFTSNPVPSVNSLASRLHSVTFGKPSSGSDGTHAFTVLARVLKDPAMKIDVVADDEIGFYANMMKNHAEGVFKHAMAWDLDTSDPKQVERKIAELQWANMLIYALPGFQRGQGDKFHADFFNMHLVTSSLFLPSIVPLLTPASQEVFLRGYLAISLTWWVARGRPNLDVESFFSADIAQPDLKASSPAKLSLLSPPHSSATNPNPWLPIIQQAILSPDDHVPKFQRAAAHYARLYGSRVAGLPDFAGTELPGADKIDGTLFIRAAGLTAQRLGRDFGGENMLSYWDRDSFFEQ
ncbi:hypothetical protein D9758_010511 [Tetrapyrgos nigripes]|uniref:Oxidoreductase AflY n=1 Tax=Tetrapyrgos nigripes TaxID=182062 RepID=A0A8H5FV49_9AGAR|nr:hypothetical protein D9758_010511 [Tetrapyrgos nigripes]